ncbi:MAG: aldehyde dehydrogenase family protein, partial [Chthoniobacterales bacterium]
MNVVIPFETSTADVEDELIQCRVEQAIASARVAQRNWAALPFPQRLQIIRRTRSFIADEAVLLAEAANRIRQRPLAEILSAEVLPLAHACRFLERESGRIVKTRCVGSRGRPLWLTGVASEVRREAHGVVLIIGASNYPLFLPAVQMLQALVAGNAVLLKPGVGGSLAADAFADILRRAGTPSNLVQVLAESPTAAQSAIALGVDKVVFTGSATTGEAVLAQCAQTLTPAIVELSGCDAMFVRADAEIELVIRAIQFGLRLNNGATCIAPRRVFVHRTLATELEERLRAAALESSTIVHAQLSQCVTEALLDGADLIQGNIQPNGRFVSVPLMVGSVTPSMRLTREDIFAPVLALITVADDAEA